MRNMCKVVIEKPEGESPRKLGHRLEVDIRKNAEQIMCGLIELSSSTERLLGVMNTVKHLRAPLKL
jgi:hypothetical protein